MYNDSSKYMTWILVCIGLISFIAGLDDPRSAMIMILVGVIGFFAYKAWKSNNHSSEKKENDNNKKNNT